jgi:hypothetical protein
MLVLGRASAHRQGDYQASCRARSLRLGVLQRSLLTRFRTAGFCCFDPSGRQALERPRRPPALIYTSGECAPELPYVVSIAKAAACKAYTRSIQYVFQKVLNWSFALLPSLNQKTGYLETSAFPVAAAVAAPTHAGQPWPPPPTPPQLL